MHLKYRNVNDAFRGLVKGIYDGSIPTEVVPSRAGECAVIEEPVIITYERPLERVLFNTARDANPTFHVYEAIWMLAGRNDVAPLAYYVKTMPQFSDDGETFHGAYGYRWRKYFGYDQLSWIIDELRANPHSRRCVLAMWDAGRTYEDYGETSGIAGRAVEGSGDLYHATHGGKDAPCNLAVHFLVEDAGAAGHKSRLNMTVFNRSNDLVWGALGANAVHFSFLQEYMAAHLDLEVGVYNQISNNLHVYTERWEPEKLLEWEADDGNEDHDTGWVAYGYTEGGNELTGPVIQGGTIPLVKDPATFDRELPDFVERHSRDGMAYPYAEPFLREVAQPMCVAYHHYKRRAFADAIQVAGNIAADDWRIACTAWLQRRKDKAEAAKA